MNFQRCVWLFALLVVSLCSAHARGTQSLQTVIPPKFYCGRYLSSFLASLCNDEIEEVQKRSEIGTGTMYNGILTSYQKDQESQLGWPWIRPHKVRGLALPSRGKRFIIDECCEKACTIEELITYC